MINMWGLSEIGDGFELGLDNLLIVNLGILSKNKCDCFASIKSYIIIILGFFFIRSCKIF